MVSKLRTHDRFSFSVRIKRSATPLPSGSRTKLGERVGIRHGDNNLQGEESGDTGGLVSEASNDLGSLRFDALLGGRATSRTIVSWYRNTELLAVDATFEASSRRSNAPDDATAAGSTNVVFDLDLSVRDLSVRQELAFSLSAAHTLDTGVELHRLASAALLSITGDRNETVANPSSARGGTGLPDNLDSSLRGTRGGRVGAGSLHGDAVAVRRASPAVGLEHRSCNDRHRR